MDELNMATLRVQLAAPGERVSELERNYKVYRHEVPCGSGRVAHCPLLSFAHSFLLTVVGGRNGGATDC